MRLELDRLLEQSNRFLALALVLQYQAQVIACFGTIVLQAQSMPALSFSLVELAQRPVSLCKVRVIGRRVGINGQRFLDEADGLCGHALLMRDDAEQVQCVRMSWLRAQDLAIKELRLVETACLMMIDGTLKLVHPVTPCPHSWSIGRASAPLRPGP